MSKTWSLALLATAVLAATPAAAQTVILARHAEKADSSADPDLSPAGHARAAALGAALSGAGLTHVLVTPVRRTAYTATPAAEAAGLSLERVGMDGGLAAHVARVAEAARRAGPDGVVLVVGHSNTIPLIARALGAEGEADMSDCEYDRLIVLDLDGGAARVLRGRYGAPTEPC